jgi:hypothetical protein
VTPNDDNVAHEYEVLTEELVRQRRWRLRLFAITTLVVAAILAATFVLNPFDPDTETVRLILIYLAHLVVVGALWLTHRRTHRMQFTAEYVEEIVEPRVSDAAPPPRRPFQSLETSRALGACYALLISAIVAAGIANGLYRTMWAIGLPLLALIGVLNANLLFLSEVRELRRGPNPRRASHGG